MGEKDRGTGDGVWGVGRFKKINAESCGGRNNEGGGKGWRPFNNIPPPRDKGLGTWP